MNEQNMASDTNESSTSSILSRSAQILQAASPYLDENTKQTLEGVVHVTDFLDTLQTFRQKGFSSMLSGLFGSRNAKSDTVSMANLGQQATPIDTESMLKSIRPYCTNKEGELIDRIMNIFSMQKFFSMYQTMQSMMSMMNMSNEANQQNPESTSSNQANPDQTNDVNTYYDTYWNSYNYNDENNTNENNFGSNNDNNNYDQTNNTNNYNQTNNNNNNEQINSNNNYNQINSNNNSNQANSNNNYDSANNTTNNFTSNTSTPNNNAQMLDMLSSIIPPEQKNTFDAMKLLLEAGMLK